MTRPFPRIDCLEPVFVRTIHHPLEHGKIYISRDFQVSIHLCACGCGEQTVLPFKTEVFPDLDWTFNEVGTFRPSVGNNNYDCRSHYYITEWRIDWLPPFGPPRGKLTGCA